MQKQKVAKTFAHFVRDSGSWDFGFCGFCVLRARFCGFCVLRARFLDFAESRMDLRFVCEILQIKCQNFTLHSADFVPRMRFFFLN